MIRPDPKKKRVSLKPKAYTELKRAIFIKQGRTCAKCGQPRFLKDCHLHHKKSRGSGGDDSEVNCEVICWFCHSEEHGPKWGKRK